jgi:MHS family proline/betaine transporter-like MFS transporter
MLVLANLYFALISANSGFAWLHSLFAIALIRVMQGLASGAFIQMELNYLNDKLAHKIDLALFGIMAGIELGQLLGVSIYRLTNVLFSAQQMEQFAWRIPFVVGVVFTLIAYLIRLAVIFSLKSIQPAKRPQMYYHIYTRFPLQSQLAIIISGLTGSTVFIFLIFIPYGMYYHLHYSVYLISHYIFMANLLSLLINFGLNKLVKFHNVVLITWLATMALVPSMLFWGWAFINKQYGLASILPIAVLASLFSGLVPRLLYGLFPEVSRALGVASCHRVGFIFFGGVAPLITIALGKVVHHLFPISNHNVLFSSSVIIYVIFMALLTLYALVQIKRLVDYKLLSKLDYQSREFKV